MRDSKFHSVKPITDPAKPQLYIETYGCQMNVNDSEVVLSVMQDAGYSLCEKMEDADVILVNTCSVRENAEQRVFGRLDLFRLEKKRRPEIVVGVIGCMAERLKDQLFDYPVVDVVAGPDAYRDLPRLVAAAKTGTGQINVHLSHEETYEDISPVRMDRNGVSAFISIMRGCNNVCSYCIVPFVRGAERSRDPQSIIREAESLIANGYKEINLLGQNVDSYLWLDPHNPSRQINFARLLEQVALIDRKIRVRFSTSHPKDMSNSVLYTMAMYDNICKHIHLPVQSGNNAVLEKMNRKYTRENYLERIDKIRKILPDCAITTDVIAGFCSETEQDHLETLSILEEVQFDGAFMFQYSERPGTRAARQFKDDVPLEVKTARLNQIIALQNEISLRNNQYTVGCEYRVLIEGTSKRSEEELMGRTSQNKTCVFPAAGHKAGDFVRVKVLSCTSATLICEIIS
jgi:tRNA-2-methylthio-N6-dimethylallyladenosine synthase